MRRGLASLILGLSLLVASVAWSGFVLLHTVLDPGRSERLADEMLDNTVLRGALVDAMADSVDAGVPGGVSLPREQLEAAAGVALDDPRVEAVVRDGIVRMHRNALEGVDEPVVIDPSAFGASVRDALVAVRPELDAVLPALPPAAITLPDTGLSFLGDVREFLDRTVAMASAGALAGAVLALLVTTDRPSVLRRVALWALAASAFWLIVGYGVPWLAQRVLPESAAVFAAGIEVLLGAMIPPALVLAGAGVALAVVSVVWDAVGQGRRQDRARSGHRAPAAGPHQGAPAPAVPWPAAPGSRRPAAPWDDGGWPPYPAPSAEPAERTRVQRTTAGPWGPGRPGTTAPRAEADPWDRTRVDVPAAAPTGGAPWDAAGPDWAGAWDRTRVEPPEAHDPAGEAPSGRADGLRSDRGPRWVEGIGYVEE